MTSASETVDQREAAHFGALAKDWWDPRGSSAMLHRLNPVRLRYLREQIDLHWNLDARSFAPLAGKRVLDMGCGAGLLAEPLALLGGEVIGVDAAAENVAAANLHAAQSGLKIEYRTGGTEAVAGETFDLVCSLEVIEHVPAPRAFVAALAEAIGETGLLVLSTPNRTAWSRLAMIAVAEGTGQIPRGTHDWNKFLTPDDLTALIRAAGLKVVDVRGLAWSPAGGFVLSDSTALDYFITAVRG